MSIELFDCRVSTQGQSAAATALASGKIATGTSVTALEAAMAATHPGGEAVAIGNLTLALEIALKIAGVGPGDSVLTLAFNCLSSNAAIHALGAYPVWLDLDPVTATIDIDDARSHITPRTKALIVYHIAGYPADMTALRRLCDDNGIALIEDANAAFGARLPSGAVAGSVGDFAVFSFYANRLINGAEGAMLLCPNMATAERARRHRRLGIDQTTFRDARGEINPKSDVSHIGISGTMNNVNAAIAMASFATAEARLAKTRKNAALLATGLEQIKGISAVKPLGNALPAYWVFMILADRQDAILDTLRARHIGRTKLHQSNHVYSGFGASTRALPGTDAFSGRMIGLPVGWWLDADDIAEILLGLAAA